MSFATSLSRLLLASPKAVLAVACSIGLLAVNADAAPQRHGAPLKHLNVDKARVALSGYDPVAYFRVGGSKAKQGKKTLATTVRGVTYRFATAKNRELFEQDPERFEPDYGGWCAWAMSNNDKVEVDPKSFLIEEGRLLVFYDGFFNDTRSSWLGKGGKKLRPNADTNWNRFVGRKKGAKPMMRANKAMLVLKGMDPTTVKGKDSGKPGLKTITTRIGDQQFQFVSKATRTAFLKNPEAYLPKPTAKMGGK